MAVILWALCLLMQGCLCSPGQNSSGCMRWTQEGDHVCCDICHPGNRLIKKCGPKPKDLCTPCEPNTYTIEPKEPRCKRCTQCVGAQVLIKECTTTADTKCGCKEGLTCGDSSCSFCVMKCKEGQEPTEKRSCRPCPNGTFSDQIHQKCKPWSTKCPHPDQKIVAMGNAVSDITCANVSVGPVSRPKKPADQTEQAWPFVLSVITSIVLTTISIIIIVTVALKLRKKKTQTHEIKKEMKKSEVIETQIISTPTDDPRTLMAIECSFHEAQQEQGRSTESLASKESSVPLIV